MKPQFISHYLVLKDLIAGIDVRKYSDTIVYLTARIENVKLDFVKKGLLFEEDALSSTKYSQYKPYILIQNEANIELARSLLKSYETEKVKKFLSQKDTVQ